MGAGDNPAFFFLLRFPFVLARLCSLEDDFEGGGVTDSRETGGVGVDLGDGDALLLVGDADLDLLDTAKGEPFLFFISPCFAPLVVFLPLSS